MRVFTRSDDVESDLRGGVLTIGNFDGLHLGHLALLRAVAERGRELGSATGVYTFDPHPRRFLHPELELPRLMSREQQTLALRQEQMSFLVREPFTSEFAALSAEQFLTSVIQERLAPREIFVGRDFHFGRGASGSDETLTRIGPTLGIRITVIPQVRTGDGDISSTLVRELIGRGEVQRAAACLGRPYAIWGVVVTGERRGRTLGFPTANLAPENELIPANGVYASQVRLIDDGEPREPVYPAVTNIGTRPTFEPGRVLAETHLLDFDGDLYGRRIELSFRQRIRAERAFSGPDELIVQIRKDAELARQIL